MIGTEVVIGRSWARQGKGPRPTVRFPSFDTTGWQERQRSAIHVVWTREPGDSLVVNVSAGGRIALLSNRDAWRALCRRIAEDRGEAVVAGEPFEEGPVPLFQFIYKAEDGKGYRYGGMLMIPRQERLWVIGASCREHGVIGSREALVAAQLVDEGQVEVERVPTPDATRVGGTIRNWFRDPFDPGYSGRVLRSLSDDEQYDALAPDHPLSRLRRTLSTIRRTLRFNG